MQTRKTHLIAQNNDAQFRNSMLYEVTSAKKNRGLGTITKSCSNQATQGFQKDDSKAQAKEYRKMTIALKERAGELLYNKKELKQNRVCGCGKHRIDKELPVGMTYNQKTGLAGYDNLQYCGSVWVCPDCSYKISQERKTELAEAMKTCRTKGLQVLMLTLTVPHYAGDDLRDLLKKMSSAKHAFWTNRNSRNYLSEQFPLVGHITATEVKFNDRNGFHPHYHILCFSEQNFKQEDIDLIQDELYEFWAEKCVKHGLGKPSKEHGLHIKIGSNEDMLADYVSKWGLASEMTQAHQKIGKKNKESLTMWEVLELSTFEASTNDKYGRVFKKYAQAFKGRAQLFWSKGLKDLLIKALTKEEEEEKAKNEAEEYAQFLDDNPLVLSIHEKDWWSVCYHRKRAELLDLIELDYQQNGPDSDLKMTKDFISGLRFTSRNSGHKNNWGRK
jgi:plasmid rolling circle replication initiator protein Rep